VVPLLGPPRSLRGGGTLDIVRDGFIVSDAGILGGKPCVRGTRLSVEFLLELTSVEPQADILARYP
jgi:uncharacterized protein (DUF433 family)